MQCFTQQDAADLVLCSVVALVSQMLLCTVKLRGAPNINSGVALVSGDKVYAFGGFDRSGRRSPEDQLNVSVFNTVSLRWMKFPPVKTTTGERPPEVPCNHWGHTAVLIEDIVYVWGGLNKQLDLFSNTLYAFEVDAHRWIMTRVSGTVPEAMWLHSACVLGKVMYVYGGVTEDKFTNDISTSWFSRSLCHHHWNKDVCIWWSWGADDILQCV